jgi:drug/metabolite transporter (DMT)-like permease
MIWIYLALLSAFLSAFSTILEKKVLFEEDALEFSFKLSLLNVLFSLPFFFFFELKEIALNSLLILFAKTVLSSLAFLNVMLMLKSFDVSRSLPMMALTPALVAVLAFFVVGDSLSAYDIMGMALLMIGTYMLELKSGGNLLEPFSTIIHSKAHRYILYALLLFTATSIMDRFLLIKHNMLPIELISIQHVFIAFNFTCIVLIKRKNPLKILKSSELITLKWILLISLVTICYRWTNIEAVKLAPVALVLSIKRTSVFFASVIGGKIFNEKKLLQRALAAFIMIVGAIVIINN